jgi:hypothetical protein
MRLKTKAERIAYIRAIWEHLASEKRRGRKVFRKYGKMSVNFVEYQIKIKGVFYTVNSKDVHQNLQTATRLVYDMDENYKRTIIGYKK